MQDANGESFHNLRENLAEIGLKLDDIPLVIQLNKRDLPSVAPADQMIARLDPDGKYETIESIAATGVGVFETLKLISKLTLRTLRSRMTGDDVKTAPRVAAQVGTFRVKEPPPSTSAKTAPIAAVVEIEEEVEAIESSEEVAHSAPSRQAFSDSTLAKTANLDAHIISDVPVASPPAEPEIAFSQTDKATKEPKVKHVKVRSSVDIMAELEALRKRATQTTPTKARKETSPLDALLKTRDVHKSINLKVNPDTLAKTRAVRVAVSFENNDGVVQHQEQTIDVDASDAKSLTVNLKINS